MANTPLPLNTPLVDPKTNKTNSRWLAALQSLNTMTGSFAPSDQTYIIQTSSSDLPNAQVLSVLTPGFIQVNASGQLISTNNTKILSSNLSNTSVTAGNYTINGAASYTVDQQGRLISAASPVITVTGTANKIAVTGGTGITPTITIDSGYVGQTSITTLGTITSGTWNGTAIANANLANSAVANLSGTNTGDQTTVSGNAGSATTTATTDDTTTNATMYPVWKTTTTGNLAEKVSSTKMTFNPSTGMFTVTGVTSTFTGNLAGNVTGNCTGSSGSCTGNAATVTTNANLIGDVTSSGNTTTIGAAKVTEAMQVLADNTTNNASTTKHGYLLKLDNVATHFMNGQGAWVASTAATNTLLALQIFTGSGTYTPTSGMATCVIEMVGGGGSGGAVAGAGTGGAAASGGSAGGSVRAKLTAAQVGASQTVTIGAGGSAPSSGANNGNDGGDTTLGSLLTAAKGKGGLTASGSVTFTITRGVDGGVGTVSTGTSLGVGNGGASLYGMSNSSITGIGGMGGSSSFGSGGRGGDTTANNSGQAGAAPGAGGGGACVNTNSNAAGGAGIAGLMVIYEYN